MTEPTEKKSQGNCHHGQPLNSKEEGERLMDSYDKIFNQWKVHNDNYFKRVQVMMVVLQGGLFLALLQRLHAFPKCWQEALLPVFLGILGILSAIMWLNLHTKQAQYLEFCRITLRNLEARLTSLGFPLEYFTTESFVFGPHREDLPKLNTGSIKPGNLQKCKNRNIMSFEWSEEKYPIDQETENNKGIHTRRKVTGRLVNCERNLARAALVVWIIVIAGIVFNLKMQLL